MEFFNSNKKFYIIAGIFLLAIFLLSVSPISDYDTGYHLQTGKYIVEHKVVPLYDIFSYTASGVRWIAHYWLSDVIFYLIYLFSGYLGLMIFVALISALTYFFVFKVTWLKAGKTMLPMILLVVFAYLSLNLWVVRPQIFSYFLAIVLVYILEKWRTSKNIKYLYWIPFLFLIWANLHAGVILGIALFALYCAGEALNQKSLKAVKAPIILFVTSSLATLLNPNGFKLLDYLQIISPSIQKMNILEWQSLLYYSSMWQTKATIILMAASFVFVWWRELDKEKGFFKMDWISLGLVTGSIIMPIVSMRHIIFFSILALPVVSNYLVEYFSEKNIKIENIRFVFPLAILLGAVLIAAPVLRFNKMEIISDPRLPENASNFIKDNNLPSQIFNSQFFGGYLIWKLWPEYKVFIDGRSEVFAGEVNNDYINIAYRRDDWKNLIDNKYKIQTIILGYPFSGGVDAKRFAADVTSEDNFVLVYFDDGSMIFVKNNPQNQDIIKKFGYQVISPYNIDFNSIPKDKLNQAFEESKRAVSESPNSLIAFYINKALSIKLGIKN